MGVPLHANKFNEIYRKPEYINPTRELIDFPLIVDVELTNNCNMRCRMCVNQQMKRNRGFMPPPIFYETMNQAKEYGAKGVRLIRLGEPLLHRDVLRFLRAASRERLLTHLTTNGKLLYLAVDSLLGCGLDTLVVSLQGHDRESYQSLRIGGSYEQLKRTLSLLMRLRKEGPFVQVTTTINKGEEGYVARLESEWKECCDELTWGYTRTRHLEGSGLPDNGLPLRKDCPEPWRKMSVDWNGDVTLCCLDYDGFLRVGNVRDTKLHDLWHSEKAERLRESLNDAVERPYICKTCELSHEFERMK